MEYRARILVLALALVSAASCATVTSDTTGGSGTRNHLEDVASLNRSLETEQDATRIAALLFRRGHAYLEEAERHRDLSRRGGAAAPAPVETSRMLLGALRDFEDIAQNFPQSPEGPEALFHLGVIYDYPNLSSFQVARSFYLRTIESYPGTESARKARVAIEKIDAAAHDVDAGRHGAH